MKNTFKKWIAFTCFLIFITCCLGPSISGNVEKSRNLVIENDDFDDIIEDWMAHAHFPGLVCGIIKNNKTVWSKGYGYADIGIGPFFKKNVTTETVFPMGSITKSITATAMMQLVENESYDIDLDDNVSKWLPFDLKNPRYPETNITTRMLLAHQSSIKPLGLILKLFTQVVKNPLGWLERYLEKQSSWLDYAPGENVTYASIDTNIVGYVLENITNKTFSDYCQENIFEPLKMYNTSFYLSDYDKSQLVRQYVWYKVFYLRIPFIKAGEFLFAGGGARSTLDDMSHYLIMHTSGGVYDGVRILTEESVEEMHTAQYPDSLDYGHHHGLGWYFINYSENETIGGHDGTHLGAYAIMKMRYSDRVGILYFYNQHSYLDSVFHTTPNEEKEAVKGIREALFDKADGL